MGRVLAALGVAASLVLAAPAPAGAAERQEAIVVLGDSAASGEGAGDYLPGTRGEDGNWCHRSPHAYASLTGLAPVAVNLACSGARAADVGLGGGRDGEPSQAARLGDLALRYRVTTVVVQVGADDDAALVATGGACIRAFLDPAVPPCRDAVGLLVAARMAVTAGKVEAAVDDVRAVMRRAGHTDDDYRLVLLSYASPVTERESFHPSAAGHAAIASCLAAFVRSGAAEGACVPSASTLSVSPGPPGRADVG